MKVLAHHIYEFKKGVRRMILHTMPNELKQAVIDKLEMNDITYHIVDVSENKFNVFFGEPDCIEVISGFCEKPLYELSPEEDFIVGVLLGYCPVKQCQRYKLRQGLAKAAQTILIE